jgi:hypothetical protein
MKLKSGLEPFNLKFKDTRQPARPIQPFWAVFFSLGSSNSESLKGCAEFFKKSLDHFTIIFKWKHVVISSIPNKTKDTKDKEKHYAFFSFRL